MQQVGNSNVQTEATWFMKIGKHVMPVKCIFFSDLSTLSYINKRYNNGWDAIPRQGYPTPLLLFSFTHLYTWAERALTTRAGVALTNH